LPAREVVALQSGGDKSILGQSSLRVNPRFCEPGRTATAQ